MFRNLFWHEFPKTKPSNDGWYQCTINYVLNEEHIGDDVVQIYSGYVMDLFWKSKTQKFINMDIENIFESYDVYGYGNENGNEKIQLHTIDLIDRTDQVVAWRPLPKRYKQRGRIYYKEG